MLRTQIWVLGAGLSGVAAARFLKAKENDVFVSDRGPIPEGTKQTLKQHAIPFEENGHSRDKLLIHAKSVVVAPGIPLSAPVVQEAMQNGIPVLSEIDAAFLFSSTKPCVVGITGTNGKSTTTHLLGHIMEQAGLKGKSCGNIGLPLSQVIEGYDYLSLELSSYQLETTRHIKLAGAAFLNFKEDHIARHKTLKNYFTAKWNIVSLIKEKGFLVTTQEVIDIAEQYSCFIPDDIEVIVIKEGESLASFQSILSFQFKDNKINARFRNFSLSDLDPVILGKHNAFNILFAATCAHQLGISNQIITDEISKNSIYSPLEHRFEIFYSGNVKGKSLKIINDSKSTNKDSLLVAIRSLTQNTILLLGGEWKGEPLDEITEEIGKKHHKVTIFTFGQDGKKMSEFFPHSKNLPFDASHPKKSLKQATFLALEQAENHSCILLSPGCASFDSFSGFEERGRFFKDQVMQYIKGT